MKALNKNQAKEIRERRMLWPATYGANAENKFPFPLNYSYRNEVLGWIANHTSGRFYLGGSMLYFEDEQDALMFRLSKYGIGKETVKS